MSRQGLQASPKDSTEIDRLRYNILSLQDLCLRLSLVMMECYEAVRR